MPANQAIRNFYTWGSFLSLSVAAGAVWTVAGTLSYAFTWSYPRYFPLILGRRPRRHQGRAESVLRNLRRLRQRLLGGVRALEGRRSRRAISCRLLPAS